MGEPDLITMSRAQCFVLDRMSDDHGYPMREIAADTGVPEKQCRAIIRHFHALNMTGFGPLHDEDSSELRGRGYWLVRLGSNLKRQMRETLCVPIQDEWSDR